MRPGADLDESRKSMVEAMTEEMTIRMRIVSTVAGRVVRCLCKANAMAHATERSLECDPMTFATRVLPLVWSRERDGTEGQGIRWCRLTRRDLGRVAGE